MRCKIIKDTFCTNSPVINLLEVGEFVQIERKFDKDGNVIVKVWQEEYLGIIDDEDCLGAWL